MQLDYHHIKRLAADIRIETVKALATTGFGHIGGAASIADVLAVLYGGALKIDPTNPEWEERDYLVLSKGHSGPALYAALALKGFFPMEWLNTINKPGTRLPSHCDNLKTPGIDVTTGSLGQGISCAVGLALGMKKRGMDNRVYCIVGDGELNEGQVWEAIMTAAHFELDHLTVFVDWNKKQLDDRIDVICKPQDITAKFRSFGFETVVVDGQDVRAIAAGIELLSEPGKPKAIILDTIKGAGVSFAERTYFNHYMAITEDMAQEAIEEINRRFTDAEKLEEQIHE